MKPHTARTIGWAIVGLAITGLVVGVVATVFATYSLLSVVREQQKTNVGTNERIVDCTTPGGKCYQQGQERTGQAVGDILKGATYAIACADKRGVQTEAEIQACVLKRIAKEKP